ncbi:MAG TPA: PEP-CTERM sorting domain-containing protein [Gemmatimonadales bacterium]|nr:PEP-CTERM sorting domain-containing protein [Gemmatimonadales bacterium]
MQRFTSYALVVLVAVLYAAPAAAQSGGGAVTWDLGDCSGQETLISAQSGTLDASCPATGSYGEGYGTLSVDHGTLGVSAGFSLSNYSPNGTAESFVSEAIWGDYVQVAATGIDPAFIALDIHISGSYDLSISPASGSCDMASFGSLSSGPGFASVYHSPIGGSYQLVGTVKHPFDVMVGSAACGGYWGSDRTYHIATQAAQQYNQTLTALLPLEFGWSFFMWRLDAFLGISTDAFGTSGPFSASLWSDFSSTMGLTGYRVYDADQNDITSLSTVNFGATELLILGEDPDDENPGSTVPEPATMTLLATGLAGMAAARRRKRK